MWRIPARTAVAYTRASQTRDFVRVELLIESGFAHLAGLAIEDGRVMTTARGYSRRIADRLVAYIGAKAKLAAQLGIERKQKQVADLAFVLAQHEESGQL